MPPKLQEPAGCAAEVHASRQEQGRTQGSAVVGQFDYPEGFPYPKRVNRPSSQHQPVFTDSPAKSQQPVPDSRCDA
jgi:hypothetical protein